MSAMYDQSLQLISADRRARALEVENERLREALEVLIMDVEEYGRPSTHRDALRSAREVLRSLGSRGLEKSV